TAALPLPAEVDRGVLADAEEPGARVLDRLQAVAPPPAVQEGGLGGVPSVFPVAKDAEQTGEEVPVNLPERRHQQGIGHDRLLYHLLTSWPAAGDDTPATRSAVGLAWP